MKTYNGMTRKELTEKIIDERTETCKAENAKKFNDGLPRMNENREHWAKYLSTLPMHSNKFPAYSIIGYYKAYCE